MPPDPAASAAVLDVRDIPCQQRHHLVFRLWESLRVGEAFTLVNDHDPIPLYFQLEARHPNDFRWGYLEAGPELFRIRIERTRAPDAVASEGAARARVAAPATPDVDCRGLEPPEPLLRLLGSAGALKAGEALDAWTDHKPMHLFSELERRGLSFACGQVGDGSWRLRIRRI